MSTAAGSPQRACIICDEPLSPLEVLSQYSAPDSVCRSLDCKRLIGQQNTLPPGQFEAHLKIQRPLLKERAAKQARINDIKHREAEENRHILAGVLANAPELADQKPFPVNLPSGLPALSSLAAERVTRYRAHLQDVIEEARAYDCAANVPQGEHQGAIEKLIETQQRLDGRHDLRQISDTLCGLCRGGCCANGGDSAYISALTIRQYMDANPHMTPQDVLTAYLSKLAPDTIDKACLNQAESGCVLPREMRSDVCNGFYCDSLKAYQRHVTEGAATPPVLAVQRSGTVWRGFEPGSKNEVVNVAFIDQVEVQVIEIPGTV